MMLQTHALCKLYGEVIGVNDLTLSLAPGVHGLLGPNGAGKSTLLKLITGQLKPSEGSLTVLGESPWNNQSLFSQIGICPESDSFYEFSTGLGFVRWSAELKGIPRNKSESDAKAALEKVSATAFMERKIATYSKGMRQRTKIAQAIVGDPKLIIFDEPLTGTDPIARKDIVKLIREQGEQGKSVFVSSHVLHEVQSMTDEFLLMFRGRVLASGNVREVRELMHNYPHEVLLESPTPKELAAELIANTPVERVAVDGRTVRVHTTNSIEFYKQITNLAASGKYLIESIRSEDEDLDKVFDYLVTGATP